MALKDILVALAPRDETDPARDYALALAKVHQAHLTAAAFAMIPHAPSGIYPSFVGGLADRVREQAEQAVKSARDRFEQVARDANVEHSFYGGSASVDKVVTDFAMRLRTSDIGVLNQHEPNNNERFGDVFTEGALLHSGRPIIVVPRHHTANYSTTRVLVAWDGSAHAARAVSAAMVFLDEAEIEVFTVHENSKGTNLRSKDLVRHLKLHGLGVKFSEASASDVGDALVQRAHSSRASMVVMGGYGHSRFREFIFGGATRKMLRDMPAPVLMAH